MKTVKLVIDTTCCQPVAVVCSEEIADTAIAEWTKHRTGDTPSESDLTPQPNGHVLKVDGFYDSADRAETQIVLDMDVIAMMRKIFLYGAS